MTEERIEIRAYAKINLCLDVRGLMDNGYHRVAMVMQQILLCDDVLLRWRPAEEGGMPLGGADPAAPDAPTAPDAPGMRISLNTNRPYLPRDSRNLAWKAAALMGERFGEGREGTLRIDIKKRIPVAAGLAGGSSNCAAVIHGLNQLWSLGLSVKELCDIGSELGSDVPFCVMGQAAADPRLSAVFDGDPLACHCAIATGRGTDLEPVPGLVSHLVLSKPPISVSTPEAYAGIDREEIPSRPDIDEMVRGLREKDRALIQKNMVNVLENFSLKRYPIIVYTKDKMQETNNCSALLMSGSGPTVFGLCDTREDAQAACRAMKEINRESFWTRTTRDPEEQHAEF